MIDAYLTYEEEVCLLIYRWGNKQQEPVSILLRMTKKKNSQAELLRPLSLSLGNKVKIKQASCTKTMKAMFKSYKMHCVEHDQRNINELNTSYRQLKQAPGWIMHYGHQLYNIQNKKILKPFTEISHAELEQALQSDLVKSSIYQLYLLSEIQSIYATVILYSFNQVSNSYFAYNPDILMSICRKVGRQKLQHICKPHKLTHLVKEINKESKSQNKVKRNLNDEEESSRFICMTIK